MAAIVRKRRVAREKLIEGFHEFQQVLISALGKFSQFIAIGHLLGEEREEGLHRLHKQGEAQRGRRCADGFSIDEPKCGDGLRNGLSLCQTGIIFVMT